MISTFYKSYSIDLIFGIPNLSNESLDIFLNKLNKNELEPQLRSMVEFDVKKLHVNMVSPRYCVNQ